MVGYRKNLPFNVNFLNEFIMKYFKKYKTAWLLGLIMILAFGVRVYNLHNWLYFQADQVRNVNHAHKILEQGWKGLPLLGPKAGGTDFHLGPISYYLEFIPVLFFGLNHPAIVVYSNLLFIILSIPLVFYFLRQGFSKNTSLQITVLYAFSYVSIQYSRFSWNPNSMLLWGLLFVLATYKIFQTPQRTKKYFLLNNRGFWLLILALSYGIVSQLHTTALLGYPGVFILFWLYKRLDIIKKFGKELFLSIFKNQKDKLLSINWKYWLGAILILTVLYTPVIVFDIQNNGHNLKEFSKAFIGKTKSDKTIGEKFSREMNLMGKYYTLNVLSLNHKETAFLNHKKFRGVNFLGIMLLFGAIGVIVYYRLSRQSNEEKPAFLKQKDFLILNFVWWLVFFVLFFPLAYKLDQMRFWFIAYLIPYICLAIIFEWIKTRRYGKIIVWGIVFAILFLNLSAVANWYLGLRYQDRENRFGRQPMTSTLQQSDWVTYEKMKEAIEYINNDAGSQTSCLKTPSKNRASYRYIFEHSYPDSNSRILRGKITAGDLQKCNVYLIKHSQKTTRDVVDSYKKDGKTIKLQEPHKFGVITVWKVLGINNTKTR